MDHATKVSRRLCIWLGPIDYISDSWYACGTNVNVGHIIFLFHTFTLSNSNVSSSCIYFKHNATNARCVTRNDQITDVANTCQHNREEKEHFGTLIDLRIPTSFCPSHQKYKDSWGHAYHNKWAACLHISIYMTQRLLSAPAYKTELVSKNDCNCKMGCKL